ncbi:YrhK family protein [Marinobacter zhanjiangensis]|nr:YrhK family protein [Marinobacter zhanjiangensis]
MAHHITNRRRSYKSGSTSFFWEGVNASTYIFGALCFVVGSVFFLPTFQKYSAAGAWLFIIGSLIYLAVSLHDFAETLIFYRINRQRGSKTILEFLTLTGYVIASALFLLGSICFLPSVLKEDWGAWGFIIGSALFAAGATISVTQITEAGTLIGLQLLNAVAICFVIGSILFLVPSIPYLWSVDQSNLTQKLFIYLAGQFIFASVLFLAGGVANFYRAYRMHHHHA